MAANDDYAGACAAIGQGNAEACRSGGSCCDSGNDFEGHIGGFQRVNFLRQAAEDARISAFQANDFQAAARGIDHLRVDLGLSDFLCAATLSDVYDFGLRARKRENCHGHEIVMKDDVRSANELVGLDGEQPRVAGAGAN